MYRARYHFKPGTVTLNGPVGLAASVAVPLRRRDYLGEDAWMTSTPVREVVAEVELSLLGAAAPRIAHDERV